MVSELLPLNMLKEQRSSNAKKKRGLSDGDYPFLAAPLLTCNWIRRHQCPDSRDHLRHTGTGCTTTKPLGLKVFGLSQYITIPKTNFRWCMTTNSILFLRMTLVKTWMSRLAHVDWNSWGNCKILFQPLPRQQISSSIMQTRYWYDETCSCIPSQKHLLQRGERFEPEMVSWWSCERYLRRAKSVAKKEELASNPVDEEKERPDPQSRSMAPAQSSGPTSQLADPQEQAASVHEVH